MKIIKKIKEQYIDLKEYAKKNGYNYNFFIFVDACKHRLIYEIDFNSYIDNRLFYKGEKYKKYMEKNHKVLHRWSNVIKQYEKNSNKLWLFTCKIDYLFSRVLYPGLDAMDYFRYEFYKYRHCKRKTFITEGGLKKINKKLNNERKNIKLFQILQDKALFNNYFSEFIGRRWILLSKASYQDFIYFCRDLKKVICKPLRGSQGNGVFIADVLTEQQKIDLYNKLCNKEYLIEEIIKQNKIISEICSESVNSIRIYSVINKRKEIEIIGSVLRIGSGFNSTDNYSSGGFAATIDVNTGTVISRAVKQNGEYVYFHPKSGKKIIGLQIPNWNKVKETVENAHKKITEFRYIGWDVVVCDDMRVVIIEGNTYAGVALQQHPMLEGKKQAYKKLC